MDDIKERAKKIKLLLLDVDGVLTDGRIIYGNYGDELKIFDVNDGLGIILLKRSGIKCAIITAKGSKVVTRRAKELNIDRIYQNFHYKIKAFSKIMQQFRIKEDQICFIGDDLIDIPILRRVGFAVSVPNAAPEAKDASHYITRRKGGRGAVREICDIILKNQDKWAEVTKSYFE